ncbi:hypothetical protein B808_1129 [Fructilactobacillus florum 8D]|uniref:Uncharacterized protein n=2 Tax=Fructilactobacillus florum TaxID=640331 RepID=W9EGB0_9LACO|nr:hypothetical protein [Fructilactobacillus florum]ETO40020.1 hypothetical protein B808_1129 [Fructilactobacillus florum 8D]KRM91614.1 hypothetical protein FC87_GL000747 [Fructilactobacillus florum DSM 22689 = JCM 16035]
MATESQKRSRDKWNNDAKNKARRKYYVLKSNARAYIRNEFTTDDDLNELIEMAKNRRYIMTKQELVDSYVAVYNREVSGTTMSNNALEAQFDLLAGFGIDASDPANLPNVEDVVKFSDYGYNYDSADDEFKEI